MSLADESFPMIFFQRKLQFNESQGTIELLLCDGCCQGIKRRGLSQSGLPPPQHCELCFLSLWESVSNLKCYWNLFLLNPAMPPSSSYRMWNINKTQNKSKCHSTDKKCQNKMSWEILNSENKKGRKETERLGSPNLLSFIISFCFHLLNTVRPNFLNLVNH